MDFKIVWTEPALCDLETITAYIARHTRRQRHKLEMT